MADTAVGQPGEKRKVSVDSSCSVVRPTIKVKFDTVNWKFETSFILDVFVMFINEKSIFNIIRTSFLRFCEMITWFMDTYKYIVIFPCYYLLSVQSLRHKLVV
jgi:hypothetical protein